MQCIVTAGPTYEPLDEVRRLTNFSTGRLGTELANSLTDRGHEVTLLIGQQATYRGQSRAHQVQTFTTTENLREQLRTLTDKPIQAVFHAAAVNDFSFGKVWRRSLQGELKEIKSGKFSTREGTLLAELIPTPKLIAELRQWFPKAKLVGWKYEVEGNRQSVIRAAEKQLAECLTDACVANGPGYGAGFGFVRGDEEPMHAADAPALFALLESFVRE
jgi:phosphopantothenoylcysteine synthetase/decarboxylase